MICPNCGFDNVPGNEVCTHCQQALTSLDLPTPQNAIEKSLMEDKVSAFLLRSPVTVLPTSSVQDALQTMLKENVGAVLVVDEKGTLLGIFSERDLLTKVVGLHDSYTQLLIEDFMTANPETVSPNDPLNFALHKMDIGGYRHVPVTNDGVPLGMISVRDMLRHITTLCDQ